MRNLKTFAAALCLVLAVAGAADAWPRRGGGGGGGGGGFTPASLGAAVPYWFDVSDAANRTVSGGLVTALANKGAVGSVSASQATTTQQPTLNTAALNGKDVATFDGAGSGGDSLSTASVTVNPPTTNVSFFYVAKKSYTTSTWATGIGVNASAGGVYIGFAGGAGADWLADDIIAMGEGQTAGHNPRAIAHPSPVPVTDNTSWHIYRADLGSTLADIYVDGTAATLTASATQTWTSLTQPITLGASSTGGSTGDAWPGQMVEWVIGYDLNSTDRQKVEGYLACKYALQGQLPSGHPYKSTCP